MTITVPLEQPTETTEEVIETISDTEVEIAKIEADKEVTIAAIHAETEQTRIEAETENKSELEKCLDEIRNLTMRVETMEQNLLTPQEPLAGAIVETIVEQAMEELPTPMEPNSIEQSTSTQTSETATEVSPESVEEEAETVPEKPRRKFIAI